MKFWSREIPRRITLTYRLIPESARQHWSLGASSSHLALANPSWKNLFRYSTPKRLGLKSGQVIRFPGDTVNADAMGTGAAMWLFARSWAMFAVLLPVILWGTPQTGPLWIFDSDGGSGQGNDWV